ncbi:unnamed protein product, partial [Effrenium voratum]
VPVLHEPYGGLLCGESAPPAPLLDLRCALPRAVGLAHHLLHLHEGPLRALALQGSCARASLRHHQGSPEPALHGGEQLPKDCQQLPLRVQHPAHERRLQRPAAGQARRVRRGREGGAFVDPRERAHLRGSPGEPRRPEEVPGPGGGPQQEDVR